MRSAFSRILPCSRSASLEASSLRVSRCFSDGKVLSEEERAVENVHIKKMEKERAEKMKLKAEKEKAQLEKEEKKAEKVEISRIKKIFEPSSLTLTKALSDRFKHEGPQMREEG